MRRLPVFGLVALLAGTGCGGGGGGTGSGPTAPSAAITTPAPSPTPTPSGVRTGLWQGTIPNGPSGSGAFTFRVTGPSSLTFLTTRVPTFSSPSGCASTWNQSFTFDSTGAFTARLSESNTSITYTGSFSGSTRATGTVSGVCRGSLVMLGMNFEANWASD
jgi:hypothetical protein